MFRFFRSMAVCTSLVATVSAIGWCGFPWSKTPSIEGVVVDSTTHRPIENVVIAVQWYKGDFQAIEGIGATKAGRSLLTATDKQGRYRIPSTVRWTPYGLQGVRILVHRPPYVPTGIAPLYKSYYKGFARAHKNGQGLRYDASMSLMGEFYRQNPRWAATGFVEFDWRYFWAARALRLEIDREEILGYWHKMVHRMPKSRASFDHAMRKLERIDRMDQKAIENGIDSLWD
jgi:hypothetical protein